MEERRGGRGPPGGGGKPRGGEGGTGGGTRSAAGARDGDVPAKAPPLGPPVDRLADRPRDFLLQLRQRAFAALCVVHLDGEGAGLPGRKPYGRSEAQLGRGILEQAVDGARE